MKKPNFFCVGFAKCGTTTLHEIFKQHPDIYLPEIKETQYYWSNEAYKKGFEWYLKRYYSGADEQKAVGEINPNLTNRNYAQAIAKDFGSNIKLIFLLRNPLNRLFSHYKFYLKFGTSFNNINLCIKYANHNQVGFDRFVDLNFIKSSSGMISLAPTYMKSFIEISNYYSHIKEYLNYFPKENTKIVLFEEFIQDTERVTKELFDFLGVNRDAKINYDIIANEGNLVPKSINSIYLYQMLLQLMDQGFKLNSNRMDGFIVWLREFLQRNVLLAPETDKSKMSDEAKELLQKYFEEDKKQIEQLLERDLSQLWF